MSSNPYLASNHQQPDLASASKSKKRKADESGAPLEYNENAYDPEKNWRPLMEAKLSKISFHASCDPNSIARI